MSLLNALGGAMEGFGTGYADAVTTERKLALLNATPPRDPVAPPDTPPPAPAAPATPPAGPRDAKLEHVVQAIYGQESGGGANPATSTAGARGDMQIIPATFNAYALPGEKIDNPDDNRAVGRRIIEDLYRRANGDPARVAVGYFSGQGNMSPLAFSAPWKEDKVDTNGKSTSAYVGDVLQRIVRLAAQAK